MRGSRQCRRDRIHRGGSGREPGAPLGAPLMAIRGQAAPEVESAYAQAYALCQQVEPSAQLLPVLAGLRRFYVVRGAHDTASELAERLLTLSQHLGDPTYQLEAHRALGTTLFFRGQLPAALGHLQQAMELYEPDSPQVSHVLGDPQLTEAYVRDRPKRGSRR
jgi:Flp pilus assembly protein TadD